MRRRHERVYDHFGLFAGLGGLTAGVQDAAEQHCGLHGSWRCIGALDSDPVAVAEFNAYTGHAVCRELDLFTAEQYATYHGKPPPQGWREATPDDILRVTRGRSPHLVASSPPCKGFSSLISKSKSGSAKYKALNALVWRGVWLVLEAFRDDPPPFLLLENVPRIVQRGADFLRDLEGLLEAYGYSSSGEYHCCGELGGLAQRRRRYLLVARHVAKVPAHLFRPRLRPLRTVGEVIGPLPLPGDPRGGALHRPRRVSFMTATRLSLVPPGKDWRALRDLVVEGGYLRDYALEPVPPGALRLVAGRYGHSGNLGVTAWDQTSATVTGNAGPTTGRFSVADPIPRYGHEFGQLGVVDWGGVAGAIRCGMSCGQGGSSIADVRGFGPNTRNNVFKVSRMDGPANTITASTRPGSGAPSIAAPLPGGDRFRNVYRVVGLGDQSPAVSCGSGPSAGAISLADPVARWMRTRSEGRWDKGGHYGVVDWDGLAGAVTASASADSGRWSVADARLPDLPDPKEIGTWVIISPWCAWHRPFTTLELAALQSLIGPEDLPVLDADGRMPAEALESGPASLLAGRRSDTKLRSLIGNAVPRAAGRAIGGVILKCLLAAEAGETFQLSNEAVWAREERRTRRLVAAQCAVETPY